MKKILFVILFLISSMAYGQLDTVGVGLGERLNAAFPKVNRVIRYINTNSANWNTAYTDRLKWDGGSTGLTAATGRTSLGGTTVGQALFTLANPSAITFIRVNANNTVTALSATDFRTALTLGNVTNESKTTMFTNSALTGVPTAPTAANGTNTTQIATTAYVLANAGEGAVFDTTFMSARIDSIVTVLSDTIVGNTVFAAKFLIDTALITNTTYTLQATDAGKTIRFSHATYQEVTIPANTMPIGSVVTFIRKGAGPVRVNVGAGVVRESVSDSCTMNTRFETYQIIFRTANKVEYPGNWRD